MSVLKLTDENFETEVLNSERTCLVDFYADWCGPCKMMSPVIDEIANENMDEKKKKINCDEEMELAQEYGVMSIPTILVIKDGEISKKFIGLTAKEDILEALK